MRTINEVVETAHTIHTEMSPGVWVPARPIPMQGPAHRLGDAWAVFMGRADAVIYPEDRKGEE